MTKRPKQNETNNIRSYSYDFFLLFAGAILGLIVTILVSLYIIPFAMDNIFQRDELLNLEIYQMPETLPYEGKVRYILSIDNVSKFTAEDVLVSVDWPLPVYTTVITDDNGTVATQASSGIGAVQYDKNGVHRIPTNHLNVISQKILPKYGNFGADVFLDQHPSSFDIPFGGGHCAELQYSYNILGVQIPRTIKVNVPNAVDDEEIFKRTSKPQLTPCD